MTEKTNYNLTPHVEDLTQIMIDLVLSKYDEIAIIAMYGSRAKGDYHDTSDLEFFAITDEKVEVKNKPAFLFNGISVDIGFKPKEDYEKIARRDGYWVIPSGTLAMAKPVYWRSEEDLEWYNSLVEKVKKDHQDHTTFQLDKAGETYNSLLSLLGNLSLARMRDDIYEAHNTIGGFIICYSIILAQANGRYLINNWGKNIDDTMDFPNQPQRAREILEELTMTTDLDRIFDLSTEFVNIMRLFLIDMGNRLDRSDDTPEFEMLDSVNALEYLYKMDKAIANEHLLALHYSISDSEQHFAKDILRSQRKWHKTAHLKHHSEYAKTYHEEFPNLRELMLAGDNEKLLEGIDITWNKVNTILQSKIDLPNFTDIDQIQSYFEKKSSEEN